MAKKRSNQKRRMPDAVESAAPGESRKKRAKGAESGDGIGGFFASKGVRETIESIAIAFVLAFLFRTFEAEAFVIPTGSMAETLRGRHKDLPCAKCGYQHLAGASEGNVDRLGDVVASTCPMCRYVNRFEPNSADVPYSTGDRILVSKFVYDVDDPERWDVVVFKFPFNAKQNYIKRLVGLPDEKLEISGGDIWVKPLGSDEKLTIARKPPEKIKAMMQVVHDTNFEPAALAEAGWPGRWQVDSDGGWKFEEEMVESGSDTLLRKTYVSSENSGNKPAWLRYHHYTPDERIWDEVTQGRAEPAPDRLITDFYGYNAFINANVHREPSERGDWRKADYESEEAYGMHWVGDLIAEFDVEIKSETGTLLLDLVEAGRHYRCAINVADGQATLSIVNFDGTAGVFGDEAGESATPSVSGQTNIRKGSHRLRLANVDNQLTLWVNDSVIQFDGPTTYLAAPQQVPQWSDEDEGDLAPIGIGVQGADVAVRRMKVFRDVYYVAVKSPYESPYERLMDYAPYDLSLQGGVAETIRSVLDRPRQTRENNPAMFNTLFNSRRSVDFDLDPNHFFTLGDNSPQSQDARIWNDYEHYVDRQYMIGKALFIYWPHATGPIYLPNPWDGFRLTLPIVPNFSRMGFVR